MISPQTPRGTKIVCVDAQPGLQYSLVRRARYGSLDGLINGATYTVHAIVPFKYAKSGYQVILREIDRPRWRRQVIGFALERFCRVTDISDLKKQAASVAVFESA